LNTINLLLETSYLNLVFLKSEVNKCGP